MEALSRLCAPMMILDDLSRGVLLRGDREMFLASSRITDRDLERCLAAIPADFVFHDHCHSGPGRIEGADATVALEPFEPEDVDRARALRGAARPGRALIGSARGCARRFAAT